MKHSKTNQYSSPALKEVGIRICSVLCQSGIDNGRINDMNLLDEVEGKDIF